MFYWLVFFLSICVVLKYGRTDFSKSNFCKVYVLLVISIGVFRDTTIGTDIWLRDGGSYYAIWRNPFSSFESLRIERGFLYLTSFLKTLYNSFYFYYGSIFALTMVLYLWAAKKMGINVAVLMAFYFMSSTIINSYNIIRQTLAISLATLAYSYLIYGVEFDTRKETWKYKLTRVTIYETVILLLSSLIHSSIIILVGLPLFHFEKVRKVLSKDIVLWLLLFAVVVLNTIYANYIQYFIIMTQETLHLGERAESWVDFINQYGDDIKSSHGILSTILSGSTAILFSRGRRDTLFCIGFIGVMLSNLGAVNLSTVGRVFLNMSHFIILYYAQIFGEVLKSYKFLNIDARWAIVLLLFLGWTSSFYFTTIMNGSVSPYKTYLF